eukprot:GAHX01005595.1.p1 GENE.GAHX01005595.1~~GAHX01005595.1.p1  ORF type:complete len:53 (-),score=3.39 GAHX01005595.1:413-571(-)
MSTAFTNNLSSIRSLPIKVNLKTLKNSSNNLFHILCAVFYNSISYCIYQIHA